MYPLTFNDSFLLLEAWNQNAGVSLVTVTGEQYRNDLRDIQPFQFSVAVDSSRTRAAAVWSVTSGELRNIKITTNGSPSRGETYCVLTLQKGNSAAPHLLNVLAANYVTKYSYLSLETPLVSSVDGPGFYTTLTTGAPAAGVDFTLSAPANLRCRVIHVLARFVTSATVATRYPKLCIRGTGATSSYILPNATGIVASTTSKMCWTAAPVGNPYRVTVGTVILDNIALPPNAQMLPAASGQIYSSTDNIQAADQWDQIEASVECWIEPVA